MAHTKNTVGSKLSAELITPNTLTGSTVAILGSLNLAKGRVIDLREVTTGHGGAEGDAGEPWLSAVGDLCL